VRSLRPPFPPIFPNWSDALTPLLVTQADRQQKRPTSREIVPVQRRRAILSRCQKRIRKQRATMVGTSDARGKRGEIRPAGTISREATRPWEWRQVPTRCCTHQHYTLPSVKRQHAVAQWFTQSQPHLAPVPSSCSIILWPTRPIRRIR